MTTITREQAQSVSDLKAGYTLGHADVAILKELARIALAAMDSEPVGITDRSEIEFLKRGEMASVMPPDYKGVDAGDEVYVYTSPPATVAMDDAKLRKLFDAWFASDCSFDLSPEASEEDNIAWRESYWYVWQRCRAAMLQAQSGDDGEPTDDERIMAIEGMEVSVDVSTCDADAGNRYFGTVTEVSELDGAKNGYILLVQDAEPNFKPTGNSPVIPDGWVACSERMPEEGACISAVSRHGEYVAGQVSNGWLELHDGTLIALDQIRLWMPLPEPPQEVEGE